MSCLLAQLLQLHGGVMIPTLSAGWFPLSRRPSVTRAPCAHVAGSTAGCETRGTSCTCRTFPMAHLMGLLEAGGGSWRPLLGTPGIADPTRDVVPPWTNLSALTGLALQPRSASARFIVGFAQVAQTAVWGDIQRTRLASPRVCIATQPSAAASGGRSALGRASLLTQMVVSPNERENQKRKRPNRDPIHERNRKVIPCQAPRG